MKSPYELKANNEDEEGGAALSGDNEGSDAESDNSSNNSSSDSGHGGDDNNSDSESNNNKYSDSQYNGNDCGEPPSDKKDEVADLFYEEYDDDVDYYDKDIEDEVEANRWSDTDSDQYRLINVLEDAREENGQVSDVDYDGYPYRRPLDWSYITDVNSTSSPRYDKHGREIPEFWSYYDSKPGSPTLHIVKEDDIDARFAALDQKLMVHSLRILTLENVEHDNERMEGGKSEHLPQHTYLGNKGKHDLFDEWMDSIERLDAFMTGKPIAMKINKEATYYMDEDPIVLMLREERTCWEPPTIVEATIELKNWAGEGAAHPMEDSVKKIKTVKSVTLAKKIKTADPITPAKNIVSVSIECISASISIPVSFVFYSIPIESNLVKSIESVEFVESVENSLPYNMISDSAYLLVLNVFISEIGKETLNNKELKHGHLEPIKEETQPINLGADDEPKIIQVGNTLTTSEKDALVALLTEFKEVFMWSYEDMPGIDTNIVQHCILIDLTMKPIKQKFRRMKLEWTLKIKKEVEKQYNARFLRVVNYPELLANVVPIPKKDGRVRMCVDF